ncbi:MAG: SRPBCC family protein, partial [Flavobacteriaceae bacterium]|nr:SRPBCC family protein [Flavobacteriaceae bacterium]
MHHLHFQSFVRADLSEVWDFFSNPNQLEYLTLPELKFKNHGESEPTMFAGRVLKHSLEAFPGIRIEWISEIVQWQPQNYFKDVQISGPFKYWHHLHRFKKETYGVRVFDDVYFDLPLGFVGDVAYRFWLKQQQLKAFAYRNQKLLEHFETSHEIS